MKTNNYTILMAVEVTSNDVLNEIEKFKNNFVGFTPMLIITTKMKFDKLSGGEFCTSYDHDSKNKIPNSTFCNISIISSPTLQPGTVIIV